MPDHDDRVPALYAGLVDDAGLFPPEELAMPAALARYRGNLVAAHPVLTHRFLCPAGRVTELVEALVPTDRVRVGVVVALDAAAVADSLGVLAGDPRVTVAVVEGPLPAERELPDAVGSGLAALQAVPSGLARHVEIPLAGRWREALAALPGTGASAKVRCGGLRAELFPSAELLGGFVHACAAHGVPFKATAGLHHALPYRDARTGFAHHGFLNLLLAACRAADGAGVADVVAMLRLTDPAALVERAQAVSAEVAAAARALFVAYGSCSTTEPIEDLDALGLLAAPTPAS